MRWNCFRERQPSIDEIVEFFPIGADRGIGLVCGGVSGNLECLDFDFRAELFESWLELVNRDEPGLIGQLVVQKTQNGGRHVVYRCAEAVPGSRKLALRGIERTGPEDFAYKQKTIKPVRVGDKWVGKICLVETRGTGGYFLAAPSAGYVITQGSFFNIPTITAEQRKILVEAALALNEYAEPERRVTGLKLRPSDNGGSRPGDAYNRAGDLLQLLQANGWTVSGGRGDVIHLRRPGKDRGQSASILDNGCFHVFSSNAAPFEPGSNYDAFSTYALLNHGGDFSAAAADLYQQGYGDRNEQQTLPGGPPPVDWPGDEVRERDTKQNHTGGLLKTISAYDLGKKLFKPRKWAVPELVTEGLTILAGPPKAGKSWLVLNFGVAVATNGIALGKIQIQEPGDVLYLALEDGERRMQERLSKMIPFGDLPENLHIVTAGGLPPLNDGGLTAIEHWIKAVKAPRLIVIDTLGRCKPQRGRNQDSYSHDTQVIGSLQAIAITNNLAVIVVHHTKKQAVEDFVDSVSGTLGLTGAADCIAVLRKLARGQMDGIVKITGRDIEEKELAVKFHPDMGMWELLGEAEQCQKSELQQTIHLIIKENGPLTAKEISKIMQKSQDNVRRILYRMVMDGILRGNRGVYSLCE